MWCPRPDSNWHSQKGKDFKSFVSTNFTTRAFSFVIVISVFLYKSTVIRKQIILVYDRCMTLTSIEVPIPSSKMKILLTPSTLF